MLNVGDVDDGSGLGLATELVLPRLPDSVLRAGPVVYVDRDGTRHVFRPGALSTPIDVTSSSTAALGALVPKALPVSGVRVCVTHTYGGPSGVHVDLWRYVSIPQNKTCSTFNPATEGTVLGFGAIRPDRVRYEFEADGRLVSLTDAAGVELRYLYEANVPTGWRIKTIYEPRSCTSDPNAAGSKCRAFRFSYPSSTERTVTDAAGQTTKYFLNLLGELERVENQLNTGSTIETYSTLYSYGQCGAGTGLRNLCSVTDPRGKVTSFTYTPGQGIGWPDRVKTINPRRSGTDTLTIDYTSQTETRVDQGNQRRRYLLDTDWDTGVLTGRVEEIEEGGIGTTTPVDPILHETTFGWEQQGWEGCTAWGDNYYFDNNLCWVRRAGSTNGVSSPSEMTSWTYTMEGPKLTERRSMAGGQSATTWGHRVQYAQGDGTLRCLDYRPIGDGNPDAGSSSGSSCAWMGGGLYAISDTTEMLTPRGNKSPASNANWGVCEEAYGAAAASSPDPDCYRTIYVRDTPAVSGASQLVSVNPTKAPTTLPCTGTAGNTGLLCEVRGPAFNASGAPTLTRYTYDLFGQRRTMTSPKAIAEAQSTGASAVCAAASGYRCTVYDYYVDYNGPGIGDLDLSGTVSAGGWLKAVTDPEGRFVAYGYDTAGNAVRTWDRNATKDLTVADFPAGNGAARPAAEKRYAADPNPLAKPWRYLVSEADPLGNKTTYTLDKNGNRLRITPPRGSANPGASPYDIVQSFDDGDLLTSRLLPAEDAMSGDPSTINEYDIYKNLIAVTDPVGNKTIHRYDQVNRRTETRWQRGSNAAGVPIGTGCHASTTDDLPIPSGKVVCQTSQIYDGVDRVVYSTDARGGTTTLTYDDLGRETSRKVQRSATDFVRTDTVYDLDGNIIGICLPRHFTPTGGGTCTDGPADVHRENRTYDHAGRLIRATTFRDSGGVRVPLTTTSAYDADGNLIRRDDPQDSGDPNDDRYTTFGLDLLGRKTSESIARTPGTAPSETTHWNYDPAGNVTSIVRPGETAGERTTAYRYDSAHRLILTVEGSDNLDAASAGLPDSDGGRNARTSVVYDSDGHPIARYEPRAYVPYAGVSDPRTNPNPAFMVHTDYDVDGRPVAQWVPRYQTGSPVDNAGVPNAQKAECPEINMATAPNHVPNGAPQYQNGTSVCLSRAEYDAAGRVITVILPTAGWTPSGSGPSSATNTNRRITYTYTGDNLIESETAPSPQTAGQWALTTYVYNGAGQPERIKRPENRIDQTKYSLDGLVIETTGAAGEVPHVETFQYDPAGNRTHAKRTVAGTAEYDTWTYTPDNLVADYVTGKTDATAGNKTSYEYDLAGNPIRVYSPAANACHATNCPAGASRGTPTRYTYTLDNLVETTTVPVASDGSKKRLTTYTYDLGGRKKEQAVREVDGTDISFVGAKTLPPATTSTDKVNLQKPAGTATGDVMITSIVINDSSPATVTKPTGWTLLRDDLISGSLRQLIYWKKAEATDPSTFEWSISTTRRMTGGIQTFRGVNPDTPIVDHDATIDTTADPDVSAPPVDTLRSGMLLHFAAVNGEGTVTAPLGNSASWISTAYNPSDSRDIIAQASRTSTTKDGLFAAVSASTNAPGGQVGAVVSLRPAVPATPDTPSNGITVAGHWSKTSGDASTGTLTITRPQNSIQVGDLLVAQIVSNDSDPDINPPTNTGNWTALSNSTVSSTLRQKIFAKVAIAADVTATDAPFSLATSTTRRMAGGLVAYRGVNIPSNLADIPIGALPDATVGTTVATPQITAPTNGELVQFSAVNAEGTISAPTGMQQQALWHEAAPNSSNTRDVLAATFREGPVAAGQVSRTATSQNAGKRIGALMALTPAATGPAPNGSTSQKFSYYPNDRLKIEEGRDAKTLWHRYDAAGNPFEDIDTATGYTVTSDYYLDGLPRKVKTEQRDPQALLTPPVGGPIDTTSYGYNAFGSPISRIEAGTQTNTTTYRYNDAALADQLTSTVDGSSTWSWTYDTAGRPLDENTPNGYKVTKTWRGDDTLATQRLVNNAQTVLADWTYHHDELYRQKSQDFTGKDAAGSTTSKNFAYTYWPTGELKTFNDGTNTKNVTWDPDGNRLTFGSALSATYNADDSVKRTIDGATTTDFEYLPFGGILRDGACNSYDGFDRLTAIRTPGTNGCQNPSASAAAEYTYDALDRQKSRTTSTESKSLRYDGLTSTVVGDKVGTTITGYVLNPDGAEEAVTKTGTATEFLFDDGHGNIATATKNNGVACAVRYNPFGQPLNPQTGLVIESENACFSGGTNSKAFYRGERRDENTGRYQLGSRTYDPKTGGFLTPDSYRSGGSAQNLSVGVDPLTRNTYSYVNGDPINFIDPDGHVRTFACADAGDGRTNCRQRHTSTNKARTIYNGDKTIHYNEAGIVEKASITHTRYDAYWTEDITAAWRRKGSALDRAYQTHFDNCSLSHLAPCAAAASLFQTGSLDAAKAAFAELCHPTDATRSVGCDAGGVSPDAVGDTIISIIATAGFSSAGKALLGKLIPGVAPRALSTFTQSTIDDAVAAVGAPYNKSISTGARALSKRLGSGSVPFQGIDATTANAQAIVRDILRNPTRTYFGSRTYDVYNALGQGARFDMRTNRFIGFLDETIATR